MLSFDDVRTVPALSRLSADGYNATAIYSYTSLQGEVMYWRVRFDHTANGKTIRPIYRAIGDIFEAGEPDDIKRSPKPLYGLHLLTQHPAAHVWIVEGEKCADTMNAIFSKHGAMSEHIALTSGSATSADKADWQPAHSSPVSAWRYMPPPENPSTIVRG